MIGEWWNIMKSRIRVGIYRVKFIIIIEWLKAQLCMCKLMTRFTLILADDNGIEIYNNIKTRLWLND